MTAQHAWRQGKVAGRHVAASLGIGTRRAYRHRDLGGTSSAASPLPGPLREAVLPGQAVQSGWRMRGRSLGSGSLMRRPPHGSWTE